MAASEKWFRLDNAAKIYPVAQRKDWQPLFRLSCSVDETVDPAVLTSALERTLPRFPTLAVRLRRGMFWYYLEHLDGIPPVEPDVCSPCAPIDRARNNNFLFRVKYHENRIAIELYHSLTDGMGGLVFLKTLVAEYLELSKGIKIPRGNGILCCTDEPTAAEREDSFLKHARNISGSRVESDAWQIKGMPETDGFSNITTGIMPSAAVLETARKWGVTLTEYMTAVMLQCLDTLQRRENPKKFLPVKVSVPVSLRKFYGSETLRNFSSFVNLGLDSRLGEYTFAEIVSELRHRLQLEMTEKQLNARFSANVRDERIQALRIAPLALKYIVMKIVYLAVGERKMSTTLSNLGVVSLPDEMKQYVERFDFVIGPPAFNAACCGAITYGGKLYLNVTRRTKEPYFERELFTSLVKAGIPVKIESNLG